ncbi:MAG TPA: hypothetical protein VLV83_01480 [Acidobacteriota bacterium]|nr:hypothetical protein [Acidobacteriota bacterium]
MLDLRSASLQPIERVGTPGWKTLLRRWAAAALTLAVSSALIWVIATRAADPQGPGRILYALHDYLYLPLKGYLWQWAYPWSLALWVPLILLGLIWGLFYLSGHSLASAAQASLLSRMLGRPTTRSWLLRASRAGLPSGLLLEAAAFKLDVAKSAFRRGETAALAEVTAELASLREGPDLQLQAAVDWAESLAVTQIARLETPKASSDRQVSEGAVRQPGGSPPDPAATALEQAFRWISLPSDADEAPRRNVFSWRSLARDLRDAGAPEGAFPEDESRLPSGTLRRVRLNRLGESVEQRRRLLEEELRRLELERRQDRLALMARRQRPLGLPVAQLPAAGRLTASLAFLYAIQSRQPEAALLWVDLLEGLHLALGLAPAQTHGEYALLVRDLPSALHYRLAAKLARARQESRESAWKAQPRRSDDLLAEPDFLPARRRIASLQLAAGQE